MRRRTFLATATVTAATALPRFAIAQSARTRTLRFVPQANLTLLDPIFTTALVSVNHGWAIYDMLFSVNRQYEIRPQMAEGYSLSDNGRTYLIKLREGLKFHNGEPVRAQDCAPSLQRWAMRETIGQSLNKAVDVWGVQDDRTLKITLKYPLPIFLDAIARGAASVPFIMPEHVAKTDPYKQITDYTGSGPFRFIKDQFVPGSSVLYLRHEGYVPRSEPADWTSGGKVAHFDRLEWHVIPDPATATAALRSGEVDWCDQVQPDLVPVLRKHPDVAIGSSNPLGFNGVLRFNHLHPPFDNVGVRRAVMMAVNQTDYLTAITGNDASASRICKSFMPCGMQYGKELGTAAMPGDLDRARAALKAAGYASEKVVIINPTDFATIAPMGDVTYDLLKQLGMNVEIVTTDWGTVTQRRASKEPIAKGGWSILHTWAPSNVISNVVEHPFLRGLGGTGWFGWYRDEETERLAEAWLQAETQEDRVAITDLIQARAFETVPAIPLGQFQIRTAYRKNLTGIIEATGAFPWNVRRVG
jgi:peptide/nickel transport system substrate-binding protein